MSSSEVTVTFPLVGVQVDWSGIGIAVLVVSILAIGYRKVRSKR